VQQQQVQQQQVQQQVQQQHVQQQVQLQFGALQQQMSQLQLQGGGENSNPIDDICTEVHKAEKLEQIAQLHRSLSNRNVLLLASDCGKVQGLLWKENQLAGAKILKIYCVDVHNFEGVMRQVMWPQEFQKFVS